MKLDAWMAKAGITDDGLAAQIGEGVDRSTVSRWRRGARVPEPSMLRRIRDVTEGEVTANDFIHSEAAD